MTSFAPEEFAPEEFFGWGQICNDEYPSKNSKNVDFDCIMNAFFDERKKRRTFENYPITAFCVRRSAFGIRRSAFGVRPAEISLLRSAIGVLRSAFGVRRSAFGVRHSRFGVRQFTPTEANVEFVLMVSM